MKAAILTKFGSPEVLSLGEVPRPEPQADQMLIKVAASGVCGHDLLNRAGHFPHTKTPSVMGHEIAGIVEETGSLISQFKKGDRVTVIQRLPCGTCYLCRAGKENVCVSGPGFYGEDISGGYGDYVIASEANAVLVPDTIPLEVAAVLSCAVGTGYHALGRAGLKLGNSVLITGASGGVGIHTVMLARLMGLKVFAVSSSAAKAERLYKAGADEVIVAEDLNFHRQVKELTAVGVDAVIEIAGQPTFKSSVRCLKAGGRMVLVGNVEPGAVALNPALAILKEIEFIGSGHATLTDLKTVIQLVSDGKIVPEIAAQLPRDSVCEAHRMMENKQYVGRVVLVNK
jgi:D-arabinose 1-dehydrogenase-like Zn-dependent alcohol dehydrogenase